MKEPLLPQELKELVYDAFSKLQQSVYFENTDLYLRAQLARFRSSDLDSVLNNLCDKISHYGSRASKTFFDDLYTKIGLRYYPKKVDSSADRKIIPANFITNVVYKDHCTIERVAIFCDVPIELHIIAVIWIVEFGYILDRELSDNCYGNRLLLTDRKVKRGRTLFKPYIRQYQKWWSNGIDAAKELLDKKEDVTIVNFDLKDFFIRVELNFNILEEKLSRRRKGIATNPIHLIFREIHKVYFERLKAIGHPGVADRSADAGLYPLPIALLSSFVLGNWHLHEFDRAIKKEIIPSYYGRYVDDLMIVLKGRLITNIVGTEQNRLIEMLARKGIAEPDSKSALYLHYFLAKYFGKFLNPEMDSLEGTPSLIYRVRLRGLQNLVLQGEKIFIYQFDAEMSPGLMSKFVEEQKERSSEFRFLSDQEDEGFDEFEDYIFEDNFDPEDVNKARFKKIEENKFRLSVYLAKMIRRKMERGSSYKEAEIDKIERYFKGVYALKHYYFWEKLFTLYLVSNRKDLFIGLFTQINRLLKSTKVIRKFKISPKAVIVDLQRHLQFSLEMALGLKPDFLDPSTLKSAYPIDSLFFRRAGYLRKQFVVHPLLHLTRGFRSGQWSAIDYSTLEHLSSPGDFDIDDASLCPHRVKFYEAVLFVFSKKLHLSVRNADINLKRKYLDTFNSGGLLEEAFELFADINGIARPVRPKAKEEYYSKRHIPTGTQGVELAEYFIKNGGPIKEECRFALINKYIALAEFEASLLGKPKVDGDRVETYDWILDQVSLVKGLDMFAMPELALPHPFLLRYVWYSARNSRAFITGIEHVKAKNLGFNFVMTCLPVNIQGDPDAVPIIRLKNHYSPEEEEWIRGKFMVVPKPKPYRYDLFAWRGFYLSTYYCYELADIQHRALFFSKVDFICAPVWNPDTHYYDSIIDSASRDMHCFMIQINTSQYGDTRVTRPTDHVRKDKAKVKGGTVKDYKVTLLVSDLEIAKLRDFQGLDYPAQKKEDGKGRPSFKPTPPDFSQRDLATRKKNGRFGVEEP